MFLWYGIFFRKDLNNIKMKGINKFGGQIFISKLIENLPTVKALLEFWTGI